MKTHYLSTQDVADLRKHVEDFEHVLVSANSHAIEGGRKRITWRPGREKPFRVTSPHPESTGDCSSLQEAIGYYNNLS